MRKYALPCILSLLVARLYNTLRKLVLPLFFELDGVLYPTPVSDLPTLLIAAERKRIKAGA